VVVGAVLGRLYDGWADKRRHPESAKRLGVLLASGLIVGESLFGVILAGLIVGTDNGTPLAVVGDAFPAVMVGAIAFAVVVAGLYLWTMGKARRLSE